MTTIPMQDVIPGRPLPAVPPSFPLDEGRVEADAAVHDLLHAKRLAVVHGPAESATF